MRNLPDVINSESKPDESAKSVKIIGESSISIDSIQGVASIYSEAPIKIRLGSAETLKLIIEAPKASLEINLRSLHDNSFVNCKDVTITTTENNNLFQIFD
jgi:hypothetical protein